MDHNSQLSKTEIRNPSNYSLFNEYICQLNKAGWTALWQGIQITLDRDKRPLNIKVFRYLLTSKKSLIELKKPF